MTGPDATAMAAAVRERRTTSEELVTEALARIDAWDDDVNAFTVVLRDQALARARAVDAADPATLGPLAGVPVSVKDHIWMAGAPATNGSRTLRDFVPDKDAVPVARLRAAGAVIVGKTNNPEFCYRGYTDNALYGLTRNPWSLDRTPGGSSGGAGASVAYGATPIALGTDGGGSIRIPSAFCGVTGHKPTFGLVPKLPGFQGWPTLSVDGPLTASVRDAILSLRVIAGAHPADPLTWPVPVPAFGTDVTGPTVIDGTPVDPFFDDWCLLALPANLTGQPATAVPTALSSEGLPLGMQVTGPRWSDLRVLAVAGRHETLTGFDCLPAARPGPRTVQP